MGLFNNLFGDSISVKVTREEFEAYEKEQREILERAKREVEQETNLALEAQRQAVAESMKKNAIAAGPGKLRRLGWKLSDGLALVQKLFRSTGQGMMGAIDTLGKPASVFITIMAAIWAIYFCLIYGLGCNFQFLFLLSIPSAIFLGLMLGPEIHAVGSLTAAFLYGALIFVFTNICIVSPSDSYVAIRKDAGTTVVEECRQMPNFVKWNEKQYLATTYFDMSSTLETVTLKVTDVLNTKVQATTQFSIYPESRKFIDVYAGRIDSIKEREKTKEIVSRLITDALQEIEKRDDVIQAAKDGFPRTLIQDCLVNLLRARLHDATKDSYWHVVENSINYQTTGIAIILN